MAKWSAYAIPFLVLLLAGCATPKPPFQAAWYLSPRPQDGAAPTIYIAVLNQSDRQQTVTGVFLNRDRNQPGTGWVLHANFKLGSGELFIKPISDFVDEMEREVKFPTECRLPVGIWIQTENDPATVQAEIVGVMPSAIPERWDMACAQPRR